jgi:hypothetical protein
MQMPIAKTYQRATEPAEKMCQKKASLNTAMSNPTARPE